DRLRHALATRECDRGSATRGARPSRSLAALRCHARTAWSQSEWEWRSFETHRGCRAAERTAQEPARPDLASRAASRRSMRDATADPLRRLAGRRLSPNAEWLQSLRA